ncbi:MAG: sensor histidine kinase [Acidimicrobiia bacterium]
MEMLGSESTDEFESVLRRVAQGARLLGFGWWALLGLLTLLDRSAGAPQWVMVSIGLAVAWGIATSVVYRTDPTLATSRLLVGGDLALAVFALTLGTALSAGTELTATALAQVENTYYGGMPILAVVVAAIRSRRAAWVSAITLAGVTSGDLTLDAVGNRAVLVPMSQIIVYMAGASIATWAIGVLRRADQRMRSTTEALARSTERTQIFEHLHDSVLQTLALIQKAADRPAEVTSLARRQERELREWLYGSERRDQGDLADLIRRSASDVEDRYGVPVEVVVVGDLPTSPRVEAMVGAVREAAVNAAKHSGATQIALYVEVEADRVVAYVRDRGRGFDPGAVGPDRRGISDSIRARMQRVGGSASVRTGRERGTEWSLEAPL